MKHLKLFEEYQSFAEGQFGTADRNLKDELPVEGEKFLVPGYVDTTTTRGESITLEPGDTLTIDEVRASRSGLGTYFVVVNDDREMTYGLGLSEIIEFLNYDIKGDETLLISPEKMLKRFPEWRGKMAGKKFGF
jgi:hypothetical protein